MKKINMTTFQWYFLRIIFKDTENEEVVDAFILLDNLKMMPIYVFNDYCYLKKKLKSHFFYDYINLISCIKYSARYKSDILLGNHHSNSQLKVQQPSITLEYNKLMALIKLLFINKNVKNAIKEAHLETDVDCNDIALISLALFILWNQLVGKFYLYQAIQDTYFNYYWNFWKDLVENLEKYTLYAAKNIFQIRKSQENAKLDRDLQNAIKNFIIKPERFDVNNGNTNGIKKDIEKKYGETLDFFIAQLYSYIITKIYMHWR